MKHQNSILLDGNVPDVNADSNLPASPRIRELLATLGYQTASRENGWHECLLLRGRERWLGNGSSAEEAYWHAVCHAFPSHAAMALLNASLERSELVEAEAAPQREQRLAITETRIDKEPETVPTEAEVAPVPEAPPPVDPPAEATSSGRRTIHEALAALAELQAEIDASADELGMNAPDRQRAVMTGWVAAARAIEVEFPRDRSVTEAVHRIVVVLTGLSKAWWQGVVRALGVYATPADVSTDLVREPLAATTWTDVVMLAADQLEEIEFHGVRANRCDEYGWCDAPMTIPGPADPDALLASVTEEIETHGGPLGVEPTTVSPPNPGILVAWASKLRWIRTHTSDLRRWAAAIGRCRYWVTRDKLRFGSAGRILSPEHSPSQRWAMMLKLPTEAVAAPSLGAPPSDRATDADLATWIKTWLPHAGVHHDAMVAALTPFARRVVALPDSLIGDLDRHDRKRMRKLREAFVSGGGVTPSISAGVSTTAANDTEEDRPTNVDSFRLAVLARTRGARALLVTNRDDVVLRDRLRDELQFLEIDYIVADPRRVQSAAAALASGRYDIVLAATGFLNHATDRAMRAACAGPRVPYVRVFKGRTSTSVRAIARHFGLLRLSA